MSAPATGPATPTPTAATRGTAYDAIVVGTGSGGKVAAQELAALGRRVLAVEAGRFGGECPYVACVPAKSLLASAHAGLSWADAVARRDEITAGRDDAGGRASLDEAGVTTLRGHAVLDGRDEADGRSRLVVSVAEERFTAPVVVLGSGSRARLPPVEGIEDVPVWTSVEALSTEEQPASLVVLGGGAVGCELAQAFAVLGSRVTLVEVADRLLPLEAPWVGELLAEQLVEDHVDVRVGVLPTKVEATGSGVRVLLEDGAVLEAERLLAAGGRSPNSADLGLDSAGGTLDDDEFVRVDARCRVLDGSGAPVPGLYAVGDVTAASDYTHSANHQARVVAADVDGRGRDADYRAVPRAVYVVPPVFGVGRTGHEDGEDGVAVRTASFDVAEVERATLLARSVPPPGERTVRGRVELVVRASDGVLVGATCMGPEADSWGGELALAVRAGLDCRLLADHVRAFPTWSEGIYAALRTLLPC